MQIILLLRIDGLFFFCLQQHVRMGIEKQGSFTDFLFNRSIFYRSGNTGKIWHRKPLRFGVQGITLR